MSDRDTAFNDLVDDQGYGALGGQGIEDLEKVKTQISKEGIESTCRCPRCSGTNLIMVPWNEAVIGSMQLVPPGWHGDFKLKTVYPEVGCASCGTLVPLHFTPGELRNYCDRGIAQGLLSKADANQIAASAQASVQATSGLMQRR